MNKLICIFLCFVLAACAGPTKYIVKEKTTTLTPPSELLDQCSITKPFSQSEYLSKNKIDKEIILAEYVVALLKDLGNCNVQIKALNNWLNEQKTIFNSKEDK
jgi:hypothetical protein